MSLNNKFPVLREWLVFKERYGIDFTGQPNWRYLLLTHVEGSENYHWSGSFTRTTMSEDWIPVKSYGFFSQDSEFEDDIKYAFNKEYRMPYPIDPYQLIDKDAPEGWLSPKGEWYPVEYGGHTSEAEYICELIIYDKEWYGTAYTELHRLGWVSVHQGYILNDGKHEEGVTYPLIMVDTLLRIRAMATNAEYLTHFNETLRRVRNHVAQD
jgi:hypothetical protein